MSTKKNCLNELVDLIRESYQDLFAVSQLKIIHKERGRAGTCFIVLEGENYRIKIYNDRGRYFYTKVGPLNAPVSWERKGWIHIGALIAFLKPQQISPAYHDQGPKNFSIADLINNGAKLVLENADDIQRFFSEADFLENFQRLETWKEKFEKEAYQYIKERGLWRKKRLHGIEYRRKREETSSDVEPLQPSPANWQGPLMDRMSSPCKKLAESIEKNFHFLFRKYGFKLIHRDHGVDDIKGDMCLIVLESPDCRIKFVSENTNTDLTEFHVFLGKHTNSINWDVDIMNYDGWQHLTDVLDYIEKVPLLDEKEYHARLPSPMLHAPIEELVAERARWLQPHCQEAINLFSKGGKDKFESYVHYHQEQMSILRRRDKEWRRRYKENLESE